MDKTIVDVPIGVLEEKKRKPEVSLAPALDWSPRKTSLLKQRTAVIGCRKNQTSLEFR